MGHRPSRVPVEFLSGASKTRENVASLRGEAGTVSQQTPVDSLAYPAQAPQQSGRARPTGRNGTPLDGL
eukprot:46162-Prymnesium_polylepis.1